MSGRDRDKYRSHPSGHQKRIKKLAKEEFLNKQRGAFLHFLNTPNEKLSLDNSSSISEKNRKTRTSSIFFIRNRGNIDIII